MAVNARHGTTRDNPQGTITGQSGSCTEANKGTSHSVHRYVLWYRHALIGITRHDKHPVLRVRDASHPLS